MIVMLSLHPGRIVREGDKMFGAIDVRRLNCLEGFKGSSVFFRERGEMPGNVRGPIIRGNFPGDNVDGLFRDERNLSAEYPRRIFGPAW